MIKGRGGNRFEREKTTTDPLGIGDSVENSGLLGGWFFTVLAMNEKVAVVRLKAHGLARDHLDNGKNKEFPLEVLRGLPRVTAQKVREIY